MKIAINTMQLMENRAVGSVGSSRIRGDWLIKHWPDAELFHFGRKYDVVIYQKAYDMEHMRAFQGIKIFDLCDPDWLQGRPVREVLEHVDACTTSTEALAEYIRQMTDKPVLCIPDRVDLTIHQQLKVHEGRAKTVLWYGYIDNHQTIDQCLPAIQRLGLRLVVLSDKQYYPTHTVAGITEEWLHNSVLNLSFDAETFVEDVVHNADIILNPKLTTGRFRFKSSNKTVIAWALGLPVAHDGEELEAMMDEQARKSEATKRRAEVEAHWDTRQSVKEYQDLIAQIQNAKTSTAN